MREASAVTKKRKPACKPCEVSPAELPAPGNEEARKHERGKHERGAEPPCRPRRAPDAERCLDEGGHQSGVTPAPIRSARKPRSRVCETPTWTT